jgi:hypothetical protein
MKKFNFLSLGMASLGSIAALGIATAPAQALVGGTLEWDNGTSDFIDGATASFGNVGDSFDVIFSPDDVAAVFIADGHFEPFFNPPELVPLVPPGGVLGTFENIQVLDPPFPPGVDAEAEYQLTNDLVFTFDIDGSGDVSGGDLVATLAAGSEFLGELLVDDAVEFEKTIGEWEFSIPEFIDDDGNVIEAKTFFSNSSILEFGQTAGASGGGYIAEATKGVPEPGTIIGLFAVGGLGLGLKRKKQS